MGNDEAWRRRMRERACTTVGRRGGFRRGRRAVLPRRPRPCAAQRRRRAVRACETSRGAAQAGFGPCGRLPEKKPGSPLGGPGVRPWSASPGQRPGLVRAPEPGQRFAIRAFAQLLERAVADLADAFPRDAEERADLLERALLAVVQAVVQVKDLALALRQILLEHAVEELAPGLRLDVL